MALHINNAETERNVRALAAVTVEPIAAIVKQAVTERLQLIKNRRKEPELMEQVYALLREVDALPRLDHRTAEEILGYDEDGLTS